MRLRFSIRDLLFVTAIIVLALAWWSDHRRLMLELHGYGGSLSVGTHYEDCKTLAEAVELAHGQLAQDGKREFAGLLTEQSVAKAIQRAIAGIDTRIDQDEKQSPGSKEYWKKTVRPVYQQIVETGDWPANCSISGFYAMHPSAEVFFEGLGARLQLATPGAKFEGYALPLLDVWYGEVRD